MDQRLEGTNADSTQKAIATMNRPTVLILGGSDRKCRLTRWPGASRKRR
ncbi:MAG: hypothetical protein ACLUI3_12895 [Christensenellales bacterium]